MIKSAYILMRVNLQNAHGYKIVRGEIDHQEGNFIVLQTDEGWVCCHRSQLCNTYDDARDLAQSLICCSYGEEV